MKIKRFTRILVSLIVISILIVSSIVVIPTNKAYASGGVTYYIDAIGGNDALAGTSEGTAWQTLGKVSSKTDFHPGDQILFKAGGSWTGTLNIKSSGAAGNPIVVGMYGSGSKPVINANANHSAIDMENVQYVTLQDFELTNYKASNPNDYKTGYYRRSGIWIKAFHNGVMKGITIKNMKIHDVTGMSLTGETFTNTTDGQDNGVNKNGNAAILLNAWEWQSTNNHARFDDLLIENNEIYNVSTIGINVDGYQSEPSMFHKNVVVRGNSIIDNGADAIVVGVCENPIVENNISLDAGSYGHGYKWIGGMWSWRTNGATFQYNEVGRMHKEALNGETDSMAFDTDIFTTGNHYIQYNYSHDNQGGFFMDMGWLQNGKNIVRYNISQNDKHNGWSGKTMSIRDPGLYTNNVFYNDKVDGFHIADNSNGTFVNNIFNITGGDANYSSYSNFFYNAFNGQTAPPVQGKGNIVGDPGFVDPGKGTDSIGSLAGYKLKSDSPLIGAGKVLSNNVERDFWNNSLYKGTADIGAFEDPSSNITDTIAPNKPTGLNSIGSSDTTVQLVWDALEDNVPLDADIYDASNNQLVASTFISSECTLSGLTANTDYSFYVIVKDRAGNASMKSDDIVVKTRVQVLVDNTAAVTTGSWNSASGNSSYNGDYLKTSAGNGSKTIKWTPNITLGGFYEVYCWIPASTGSQASNAQFTVYAEGGSKTYNINENNSGGKWELLGMHKFAAGVSGYVELTDNANGEVIGDAIKLLYIQEFTLDNITKVKVSSEKLQLHIGETEKISTIGTTDASGIVLDLAVNGANIRYVSDNDGIATIENGVITGKASGNTFISVLLDVNGNTITSNKVEVVVGPQFTVRNPEFTDLNGDKITAVVPGLINTSVLIINSSEKQKRATLIATLYSPQGFVKAITKETVVNKYGNITLSAQLTAPQNVTGYYMKVFVWDSTSKQRPLKSVTIFP
jgi:hypothetical protein